MGLPLSALFVGTLGHLHEQPFLRIDDLYAVDGKCAADGHAGDSLNFAVNGINHSVDSC